MSKEGQQRSQRSAKCGDEAAGETWGHLSAGSALPHHKGHCWSSQRQGGEGESLSPASHPAGRPGRQTCC